MNLQTIKSGNWSQSGTGAWVHEDARVSEGVVFGSKCIVAGGTFHGGYFHDGYFRGGTFHAGDFYGGDFRGGYFHGGYFHGGTFYGGDFYGGYFKGGSFEGGTFRGGTFHDGSFHDGSFHDGSFRGGSFHDGNFRGGSFHDGSFRGGSFHDGSFRGGDWTRSPIFVQPSRYFICESDDGFITSGCMREKAEWWTPQNITEAAKKNDYSEEQIEEYLQAFAFVIERMEAC